MSIIQKKSYNLLHKVVFISAFIYYTFFTVTWGLTLFKFSFLQEILDKYSMTFSTYNNVFYFVLILFVLNSVVIFGIAKLFFSSLSGYYIFLTSCLLLILFNWIFVKINFLEISIHFFYMIVFTFLIKK